MTVNTTVTALRLARQAGVEMPIAEQVHRVLFEGRDVGLGVAALMRRQPKQEQAAISR